MPQGVFFRSEVSTAQSVFCHEKFVNIPLGFIAQNLFVVIIAKQILFKSQRRILSCWYHWRFIFIFWPSMAPFSEHMRQKIQGKQTACLLECLESFPIGNTIKTGKNMRVRHDYVLTMSGANLRARINDLALLALI